MFSMRTRKVKVWEVTWDGGNTNMSILERKPGKESRN
jgi:hypothetical protein